MTTATRFEELDVWQNAKELTSLIYRLSASGTFARDFGLRDQMRRAAVPIMSNIAEGFESQTQVMFMQYLARAKGSAGEVLNSSGFRTGIYDQGRIPICIFAGRNMQQAACQLYTIFRVPTERTACKGGGSSI